MAHSIKKNLFTPAWLIYIVLALLMTSACSSRLQPVQDMERMPIPDGLSMAEIESAIKQGAVKRSWVVKEVAPGHLTATLYLREHMAKVDIRFNQESYSITYVDSDNLMWESGRIHRNYNSWIQNLNSDIQASLNAAA